jgi:catechol 2,3-dioxygenase-like lactoylglutathione lyase family enzyme
MTRNKFAAARTALQRSALLAMVTGLATICAAQTPPAIPAAVPAETPTLHGIAHIAVRVADIAASVAFYNKLGFEQAFAMTGKDGNVSQSFIKINDRQFIELYPVSAANPQAGFLHLCFEGADLNAIHDYYVAEGLTPSSVREAGAGNLLFTLKGPQQFADPQNIEYTQYMPGSLHSNDTGKHLGAGRIADTMILVTLAMQDPAAARKFYNDKLGFVPVSGGSRLAWRFGLPGASREAVEIVPVESLGEKSSILLTSPDIHQSGALLEAKGVPFSDGNTLTVADPDGNLIRIVPQTSPGL